MSRPPVSEFYGSASEVCLLVMRRTHVSSQNRYRPILQVGPGVACVQKNRSGKRLKTDSETGVGDGRARRVRLARFARVRLLRQALPISLLILRKNPTVLQSSHAEKFACSKMTPAEQ